MRLLELFNHIHDLNPKMAEYILQLGKEAVAGHVVVYIDSDDDFWVEPLDGEETTLGFGKFKAAGIEDIMIQVNRRVEFDKCHESRKESVRTFLGKIDAMVKNRTRSVHARLATEGEAALYMQWGNWTFEAEFVAPKKSFMVFGQPIEVDNIDINAIEEYLKCQSSPDVSAQ